MATKWVKRWGYELAAKPSRPGVYRMKTGGFFATAQVKNAITGKQRRVSLVLHDVQDPDEARVALSREVERARTAGATTSPKTSFAEYAALVFERKLLRGKIRSAHSLAWWKNILEKHLIPAFGGIPIENLSRAHIEIWQDRVAKLIATGDYSPYTANTWFEVLKIIVRSAVAELGLPRDPIAGVSKFDLREHSPYSHEQPNSLLPDEVPVFLAKLKELYPQHYAMAVLGFATGLRPSSLRPLRRSGPTPDVLWEEGAILVRRSHTRGDTTMQTTKTDLHQRIALPKLIMEILEEQVAKLPAGPMRESELLFPGRDGGFQKGGGQGGLATALGKTAAALEMSKRITPRALRRTFQDLARAAAVADSVARSISGHQNEAMQRHYSTFGDEEKRAGIGRVAHLFLVPDEHPSIEPDGQRNGQKTAGSHGPAGVSS
jgi:integrase